MIYLPCKAHDYFVVQIYGQMINKTSCTLDLNSEARHCSLKESSFSIPTNPLTHTLTRPLIQ